jgi:hypothetical protein
MRYRLVVACVLLVASVHAGQKLDVKIIDRRDNATRYAYVVPGSSQTNANANANCVGGAGSANCTASGTSTTSTLPPRVYSYDVTGATLSLQLPDGRLAVVNCSGKANWTELRGGLIRSCRIPLVDNIQAEFDGDNAKLMWSVSIDGKKMQSETYKILAVIEKP